MRNPDCILIRVGEQALKSRMVRALWFKKLKENIKRGLKDEGIEFKMETNPNRIFLYTEKTDEAIKLLKRVFGVTSVSPVWTCYADIPAMRLLAADLGESLGLNKEKSFAIRARTAGRHKFSSKLIEEEAGAAVKRVTGAAVNLSNPEHTIFIECRSRKASVFAHKIRGAGGLPLGVSGRVLAIVKNENDLAAAWLAAKRGCDLVFLSNIDIGWFEKWLVGRKLNVYDGDWKEIYEKNRCGAVVTSTYFDGAGKLVLNPLFALPKNLVEDIRLKIVSEKLKN